MQRRHLLLASLPPLALSACGFRLRGTATFKFSRLQLSATTPVAQALRRQLTASGVLVLDGPTAMPTAATTPASATGASPATPTAEVVLHVLQDQRERAVVGQTSSGQVRELELRLRFRFRLTTIKARELIAPTEILQTRDLSYNETLVLGKEAEEGLLYNDMQADVVEQVMRRLATVTP